MPVVRGKRCVFAGDWVGCTALQPTLEVCDNIDNDCDGQSDEGLTQPCANGCGVEGVARCVAGRFSECDAPAPVAEICNGRDDDCDGLSDENIVRACDTACGRG